MKSKQKNAAYFNNNIDNSHFNPKLNSRKLKDIEINENRNPQLQKQKANQNKFQKQEQKPTLSQAPGNINNIKADNSRNFQYKNFHLYYLQQSLSLNSDNIICNNSINNFPTAEGQSNTNAHAGVEQKGDKINKTESSLNYINAIQNEDRSNIFSDNNNNNKNFNKNKNNKKEKLNLNKKKFKCNNNSSSSNNNSISNTDFNFNSYTNNNDNDNDNIINKSKNSNSNINNSHTNNKGIINSNLTRDYSSSKYTINKNFPLQNFELKSLMYTNVNNIVNRLLTIDIIKMHNIQSNKKKQYQSNNGNIGEINDFFVKNFYLCSQEHLKKLRQHLFALEQNIIYANNPGFHSPGFAGHITKDLYNTVLEANREKHSYINDYFYSNRYINEKSSNLRENPFDSWEALYYNVSNSNNNNNNNFVSKTDNSNYTNYRIHPYDNYNHLNKSAPFDPTKEQTCYINCKNDDQQSSTFSDAEKITLLLFNEIINTTNSDILKFLSKFEIAMNFSKVFSNLECNKFWLENFYSLLEMECINN